MAEYYSRFAADQILVLCSEHMDDDTAVVLGAIENHVGLRPHRWSATALERVNVGGYEGRAPAAAVDALTEFYAEPNRALFARLGRTFPWRG